MVSSQITKSQQRKPFLHSLVEQHRDVIGDLSITLLRSGWDLSIKGMKETKKSWWEEQKRNGVCWWWRFVAREYCTLWMQFVRRSTRLWKKRSTDVVFQNWHMSNVSNNKLHAVVWICEKNESKLKNEWPLVIIWSEWVSYELHSQSAILLGYKASSSTNTVPFLFFSSAFVSFKRMKCHSHPERTSMIDKSPITSQCCSTRLWRNGFLCWLFVLWDEAIWKLQIIYSIFEF